MRRDLIGRNLAFLEQQALANEKGVAIPNLLQRILCNFLEHARSNTYLDVQLSHARTSTLIQTFVRNGPDIYKPASCGYGDAFGLVIDTYLPIGAHVIGLAVALTET